MERKGIVTALLLAVLLAVSGLCAAEEMPATPTDLTETDTETESETDPIPVCAHENVSKVIYFFDSSSYTSLSLASHRVSGPGVVAVVCRDCGATLSEETVDNAEEVRPHSMKKGVCALCGYRAPTEAKQDKKDAPGERTLVAQPDGNGFLFLTLTEQDLAALENAKVRTLLVRGEHGKAVVAVDVKEDGSLFAGLSLSNAPGRKDELDIEGVTLRFYGDKDDELKIALDPTDGDKLTEAEGQWDDSGFWFVPYISEGNYIVIR